MIDLKRNHAEVVALIAKHEKRLDVKLNAAEVVALVAEHETRLDLKRTTADVVATATALAPMLVLSSKTETTDSRTILAVLKMEAGTFFGFQASDAYRGIFIRPVDGGLARLEMTEHLSGLVSEPFDAYSDTIILVLRIDNGVVTLRVNSVEIATAGDAPDAGLSTVGSTLLPDTSVGAHVGEVIVFASAVSDSNIDILEGYLDCKWVSEGANETNDFCIPQNGG